MCGAIEGERAAQSGDVLHAHLSGSSAGADAAMMKATEHAAKALMAAKGRSVALAGSNNEGAGAGEQHQQHAGQLRQHVDLEAHTTFKQGDDAAVAQLVKDMNAGGVGDCSSRINPAYSPPNAVEFQPAWPRWRCR